VSETVKPDMHVMAVTEAVYLKQHIFAELLIKKIQELMLITIISAYNKQCNECHSPQCAQDFEVPTALSTKMAAVLWVVAPCRLLEV
jgi:hypothetical protein